MVEETITIYYDKCGGGCCHDCKECNKSCAKQKFPFFEYR